MPTKIRERRMAIPIDAADTMDIIDTWFRVRGIDTMTAISTARGFCSLPRTAVTAWNTTVQAPLSLNVLKTTVRYDRQGLLTLSAREDVETDQENVVQKQHDSGEFVGEATPFARLPRKQVVRWAPGSLTKRDRATSQMSLTSGCNKHHCQSV